MKIGIITYWSSSNNYGQQLQCYAFQRYLISQGHDAFLIRYQPINSECNKIKKCIKKMGFHFLLSIFFKKYKLNRKIERLNSVNRLLDVRRNFEGFRNSNLRMSASIYRSIEELRNNPPIADVYICGSDQIWNNPLNHKDTAGWYLDFGKEEIKRLAYAVSIGRDIFENEREQFIKYHKDRGKTRKYTRRNKRRYKNGSK